MWWKTLIREPNHGERFLPLLLTGALAAYLLIFWYIGKENYAAELARKEELSWARKQDSIRLAEAAMLNLPPADPSLSSETEKVIEDSPDRSVGPAVNTMTPEPGVNPGRRTTISDPFRPGVAASPVNISSSGNRYHIIAGSFSTDANARNATTNFRKLGYEASVVLRSNPDGSVSRLVSLKSFGSHEEASGFRNEIRKNTGIEAWIYTAQP